MPELNSLNCDDDYKIKYKKIGNLRINKQPLVGMLIADRIYVDLTEVWLLNCSKDYKVGVNPYGALEI